jgi:hypothetical protein
MAKAGVMAVSLNYSLAPEHSLPTAYDYSWTESPLPRRIHVFPSFKRLGISVWPSSLHNHKSRTSGSHL